MLQAKSVAFGTSKVGLSTVAYQLRDPDGAPNGSQVATGIVELGAGQYGALVNFPDSFQGFITWTSGEVSPVHATEEVDLTFQSNINANSTILQLIKNKTDLITVESVNVSSPVYLRGDHIIVERGSTLVIPLTGLGSLAGRDRLYFTVKESLNDADEQSRIQIEETDGLRYLNGGVANSTDGSLTVDDEAAGNITIRLTAGASALLETIFE